MLALEHTLASNVWSLEDRPADHAAEPRGHVTSCARARVCQIHITGSLIDIEAGDGDDTVTRAASGVVGGGSYASAPTASVHASVTPGVMC